MRFRTPLALTLFAASAILIAGPARAANDRYWNEMWGIHKIQANKAWATSAGRGVLVAVIDSGVDFTHPDLEKSMAGSYTCLGGNCREHAKDGDSFGHGTHVAGTIGATTGNGIGVASVAPEVRIVSYQVGTAREVDGLAIGPAIRAAAARGAKVINMSLGTDITASNTVGFEPEIVDACGKGSLIVAASGNNDDVVLSSYAGAPEECLLVVGATGPKDERSFYTSGSENVVDIDVFAPGGNPTGGRCELTTCILSTTPKGGYSAFAGTSMAAPHASGVAALLKCQGLNNAATVSVIKSTADDTPAGKRINALKAVSGRPGGNCGAAYADTDQATSTQGGGGSTSGSSSTRRSGGGATQPGQEGGSQGQQGQGEQIGLGDYRDPEAGSLLASEQKKKGISTKTLINIGIGAVLLAAGIGWYFFARRGRAAEE